MSTGGGQLGHLAQLLGHIQYPIENVVFKQKRVNLDGYTFRNCAFVDCTLYTSVGNFRLEECFIHSGSFLIFLGNAVRVTKLASLLNFERSPELRPEFHPDGSCTIK